MAEGVNVDGAGMDMRPSDTSAIVETLAEAARALRQNWLGKLAEIAGLDSQLGNGPLGRQFAAEYNVSVRQLVEAVDELGGHLQKLVDFGRYSVNEYVATEQSNAQRLNNL
jgi:hypothetical protein